MSTSARYSLDKAKKILRNKDSLAPVKLTDPAHEFVHNRVAIHSIGSSDPDNEERIPAPAYGSHGNPESALFEQGVEGDAHCEQFAEVLRSFEESLPDNLKTRFNLQAKHTWSEVISEAQFAEIKYNRRADKESPFGRVRGFFRILRSNSPAIQGWLDLLPTDSMYGSLICGGLKVILRAATRMDEVKDFIVGAMAAIPDEVEKAQLLIDYNEDQDTNRRLYNSVSSLYCAAFDILNEIINWFKEKSIKRHAKAFLQQDTYEKKLEEKVDVFKKAVLAVKGEAEICGFRRLQTMDKRIQEQDELKRELLAFLRSSPNIDPHTRQWRPYFQTAIQVPALERRAISRQSLCEAVLRYDEDIPWADLATIMNGGSELSLRSQDKIVYVIESEALQSWLLSSKNAALLIRGHSEEVDVDGSTSAISFVAAHVTQSTRKAQHKSRLLSLCWFANEHQNTRSDADANVHGVMRSLIGQLVQAYNGFDLYFIKRKHALAIREQNDLETLCDVFDNLIFQLPEKTIAICVIDWLACLEYREKRGVLYLVRRLLSIVRHSNENGSRFKLLLTHTSGTFRAADAFTGKGAILDVPEDGNGNGMGFNKLMWDANVGDKFERMATKSAR